MRSSSFWLRAALAAVVLIAFFGSGGVLGYMYGRTGSPALAAAGTPLEGGPQASPSASAQDLWKPFWETYNLINSQYYGRPVDQQKLMQGAAEGMMSSLGDPYSTYLPPQQNKAVQESMSGQYEGIGVYVDYKNKEIVIVAPIPGSPAEKAGLKRGDVIIAVNGQSVVGQDAQQVVTKVRGPANTSVTLTVRRGSEKLDRTIVRQAINVPQVVYKKIDGNIAYIQITIFGDKTTSELDKALRQAQQDGAKGIILDLRDNGGGWVDAAREVLGRFLPNGVALYEDRTQGPGGESPLNVIPGSVNAYDTPLVVLVNKGTASASEIVSGALQARGRARLVGDQTFGKGSEQSVNTLSGNASVHITIAHWLTPKKVDIHGKGLTPDVLVKTGDKDVEDAGPQFTEAVKQLRAAMGQ